MVGCRPGKPRVELFQDSRFPARQGFWRAGRTATLAPSLAAEEVAALIARKANISILDVRRFDECATIDIPGSISVPGAELVLRTELRRALIPRRPSSWCAGAPTLDHRHAVADQCRRPEQGGGLAKRHHRLDAGREDLEHGADRRKSAPSAEPKPTPATLPVAPTFDVSVSKRRGRSTRRTTVPLSLRRSLEEEIHGRSHRGLSPLSGWTTGAGDRHGRPGARRAGSRSRTMGVSVPTRQRPGSAQMGWETCVLEADMTARSRPSRRWCCQKPDPSHRYRRPYVNQCR